MKIDGNGILDLGEIDTRALQDVLPHIDDEFWSAKSEVRIVLAGNRQGNSIFLQSYLAPGHFRHYIDMDRALGETGNIPVFRDPFHRSIWMALENNIFSDILAKYPNCAVMQVQLATLPGGASIKPHTDAQFLKEMHRLHIPLITNRDVVFPSII